MWKCGSCGHSNQDWDARCSKCGSTIDDGVEHAVRAPVAEEKAESEPIKPEKEKYPEAKKKESEASKIKCVMCGCKSFTNATVHLANAIDKLLMETQWNSAKACCLICNECGYVHFFIKS